MSKRIFGPPRREGANYFPVIGAIMALATGRRMFRPRIRPSRTHTQGPQLTIGKLIRVTPGKRHAWFESSIGSVKKPIAF